MYLRSFANVVNACSYRDIRRVTAECSGSKYCTIDVAQKDGLVQSYTMKNKRQGSIVSQLYVCYFTEDCTP